MLILLPVAAHATPYVRAGTAVYADRTAIAAAAPPIAAPAPVATVAPVRLHAERIHFGRHHVSVAAGKPVETTVAPTPAAEKATQSEAPRQDGPHESPAPTMADLVSKHARENGIPEKLANAVVQIESRYNPSARGGSALGLMQIKVQTARSVGFSGDWRGLMAPETNLHFGMRVLADAYKTSRGDVCMALAKYQSGHLTTRMSAANRAYCARARAIMADL